jgi:hypothetical protein
MCSNADWEKLRRRVEDAVESEDLQSFMSEAAAGRNITLTAAARIGRLRIGVVR